MPFQASWVQAKLAKRLRDLRQENGLSGREAAAQLGDGWSQAKISRIESTETKADPLDVIKLGKLYGLPDSEIEQLCEMARDSRTNRWWKRYEEHLSETYYMLIGYENDALRVRSSQPHVVPGLLQTREYAAAVIAEPVTYDDEKTHALIEVRMLRQRRLTDPEPLKLEVVIAESVLHWQFGGPEVLHAQLLHLREMAERDNVSVQVVPFTSAITMLPVQVFQFTDSDGASVAFSETHWTNELHEGPQDARRAHRMFERHASRALSPEETSKLIEAQARKIA